MFVFTIFEKTLIKSTCYTPSVFGIRLAVSILTDVTFDNNVTDVMSADDAAVSASTACAVP